MAAVPAGIAALVAQLPVVRAAVDRETEELADRARALLAAHRESGQARIEVSRDGNAGVVALVDPAAISIEYGRGAYTRSDGRRVGAAQGLHILGRAPPVTDVEDLLLDLLRLAAPGVRVGTYQPTDLPAGLPVIVGRRFGGAAIASGLLDRATCDVQVWAGSRRAASDLAQTVRLGLVAAWEAQTVTPHGHLAFLTEVTAPVELITDDQPFGAWRYQATYSLGARP